ncbi:MAG TPA: MFS transporter [Puia sp.]|nr:MFS transporter [Puia sp.]
MTGKFPYRYRVVLLLFGLTALTYIDRICISLVGVRIKSDLGLSNEQFGWVLASFALAYALFEIPSGALGDRFGPRAVFIRIVLLWSLFTMLTGLATGLLSLILIRFLFGIGESGSYPNISIVISRWFPVNEMGRAITRIGVGAHLGSALAPLFIVPLAVAYGWRMPFFVNGVIGLIWVAICFYWFRNSPSEMKNISQKEKEYIEGSCRHRPNQRLIPWKYIFRHPTLWALMGMFFCNQWANYFFIAWMPVYLQEGKHFTENEMKTTTFLVFLGGVAGILVGGYASDVLVRRKGLRFGRRSVGMLGLGMCGLLVLFAAISPGKNITTLCLILANWFFGFCVLISFIVCADIGRNNAGTVAGAMNFFGQMGSFFLAIIFGKIADATHSFNAPMFVLASVLVLGCLIWLGIDAEKQIDIQQSVSYSAVE